MKTSFEHLKAKAQLSAVKALTKVISVPRPLVFIGADSALQLCSNIQHFGLRRILIVTDHILLDLGIIAPIAQSLKNLGVDVSIFAEVKPDPTFDIVENGITLLQADACDSVLAIGGGSAIDTAKVIALAASNHKSPKKLMGLLKARQAALPLFAIPTTSGTGSEVTLGAVLSDNITHQKGLVIDPKIVPLATALDPNITKGMPNFITADTGLDALTHALEAWVSTFATKESNFYAKAATKLIFEHLETAYNDGENLKAREAMALASHYAGLAINTTGVGYVHAIAHQLGARYHIPHGRANAVVMPHVFNFGRDVFEKKIAMLAKDIGLAQQTATAAEATDILFAQIQQLLMIFKIDPAIKELKKQDFSEITQAVFTEAHGMYSVPKYMHAHDVEAVLNQISA